MDRWRKVVGRMAMVMLSCSLPAGLLPAQGPGVHYLHHGAMPPGAIGSLQLQRGGPLPGFFQPVQIKAPPGALISLAEEGRFGQFEAQPVTVGMLIGQVYRFRVGNIPLHPGAEVFPTIEVINRLYAPAGQEQRFPIPVELTAEDLVLALEGKFVTRVIYLEDPQTALAISEDPQTQTWFEAGPGHDPLALADQLGRPVVILRLGARMPAASGPDESFFFGSPALLKYLPGPQPSPAGSEDESARPARPAPPAAEATPR